MKVKILTLFVMMLVLGAKAQEGATPMPLYCQFAKFIRAEIKGSNVNIRTQPSLNASVVTRLNDCDVVTILDISDSETINGKHCNWFKIEFYDKTSETDKTGWVFGAFIYYKAMIEATYTSFMWVDYPHFEFVTEFGKYYDMVNFQDQKSPIKWDQLVYFDEENFEETTNPAFEGKYFRLTIEYKDADIWLSDFENTMPGKDEVLTKVELIQ